jgi:phosphoglycerate dehydrogenase-like enzyme
MAVAQVCFAAHLPDRFYNPEGFGQSNRDRQAAYAGAMITVCVPDHNALALLGSVPDGVTVLTWNGEDEKPAGLERTEFWVPQVEDATNLAAKFAALPRLKVMQLTSAGIEDVAGQIPDGVILCDARGVHGSAVAELAVLMILASQRRLPDFLNSQLRHRWEPEQADDLRDKRIVIVGAGDLGEQTAKRLRCFDAVPVLVANSARDGVRGTGELPELLADADMVVLTLPLTDQTEGMVDAEFLARMPDGAANAGPSRLAA